jgi:hypothetical protein
MQMSGIGRDAGKSMMLRAFRGSRGRLVVSAVFCGRPRRV